MGDNNSDHRDNNVVVLLSRLPTPHESHLVFILSYSFLPLNRGWFYNSFVSKRMRSTWYCVASIAGLKYCYSLFLGLRFLIPWEASLHLRSPSILRLPCCKKFKLPRGKFKWKQRCLANTVFLILYMRNKTCVNLEEIILDVHPSVTFKQFQPSCQLIGTTWGTPSGNYSNELSQHTEPWAIENKSLLCAIKFCGVQVIDNQKIIVIKQHRKPKCIEDLLYSRHDATVRYINIQLFNSPATLWHVHHNFIFSK